MASYVSKTVLMKCLMELQDRLLLTDGGNTTKSGMIDYVFKIKPKYILIDEIDKMPTKENLLV
ncbi:MAG: hypothetical protein WBZ20_02290 [Nitrososphaeraceae archaeon]